jgi:uncharacterized membrane protein
MLKEILEIITIGLPFCAFKIITGSYFHQHWLTALGVIDLFINVVNLLLLMLGINRVFDACLLSFLVRKIKKPEVNTKQKWQDLGNSIDVLLSFSLVAYMIGGGFISSMPNSHLLVWNVSVILNVFGAGYSRLTSSIENLRS